MESGRTSANTGSALHQRTACGVAEKVKAGTITSPPAIPAARSIAIIAVWPLQNVAVGTPRYSVSCRSNSRTQRPLFVTLPDRSAS